MDAGLLWTAVGTAAGVLGTGLVAWQVRLQIREHHDRQHLRRDSQQRPDQDRSGLPVAVPFGRLPAEIRGRDSLLAELRRPLSRWGPARRLSLHRQSGHTWVLAGMGGLGKSTMALAAAQTARARGWRVWWVTAANAAALTGGMLEVLHQLGAPETVTLPVREGAPAAADRVWEFLNGPHPAGRRWLLVLDNADNPAVLAASGAASPADHTGWLRPEPAGMVIVTSRHKDLRSWGPRIMLRQLAALDEGSAAEILADLAPAISDPDGQQARDLARRLGGLPLALHLAGSYLASPFARWRTFADYRRALDSVELPAALSDLDETSAADARTTIQRTWDLSLDALDAVGRLEARPVLLLLSCYAPATPVPAALLQPQPLVGLLAAGRQASGTVGNGLESELAGRLRVSLRDLAVVGLIDAARDGDQVIVVHPVIADVNRARLQTTARPLLPGISEAAVRQVQAATSGLDHERPADWAVWRRLVPHILAVVEWLSPHLSTDALAALLTIASNASLALIRSGNPAAAEKLARSEVAVSSNLGNDHPASLFARHALAAAVNEQGHNSRAEELYREVLAGQQRVLGADHPDTLTTRHEMARVIGHSRYLEAERLMREVLADRRRVLGDDHPRTLATWHTLARTMTRQGRDAEGEQIYRWVLTARQRILGEDHPDTMSTRHGLAYAISRQGRHAEAEHQHRQVLADQQKVLSDDHPHILGTRHDLALSLAGQGRHTEAEQQYRQVLTDQQRILGDDHPATLYTRLNLATAIAGQGRNQEAERLYRQLITQQQQDIGDEHPITLITIHALADTISAQGRHIEAETLYRQVLAAREHVLGDHHPYTLATRYMLAQTLIARGRGAEAGQLLREVLAARKQVLGNDHPQTQTTRQALEQVTKAESAGRPGDSGSPKP
jgi:tetratricopeptide (TPR) repeat protein